MAGKMDKCPICGRGIEWGKRIDDGKIIFFWRCSHCGWKGEDIASV